jgi:arylsulfatase A-like enzyme
LALVGVKPPVDAAFDGEDMSSVWLGGNGIRTKPLFWEYGRNAKGYIYPHNPRDKSPNVAVRDGRWKLLVNADGRGAELFDLNADPEEKTNLAGAYPEIAERLTKQALSWRKSLP